eukprot:5564295-Prymnesium_polylepis.1
MCGLEERILDVHDVAGVAFEHVALDTDGIDNDLELRLRHLHHQAPKGKPVACHGAVKVGVAHAHRVRAVVEIGVQNKVAR